MTNRTLTLSKFWKALNMAGYLGMLSMFTYLLVITFNRYGFFNAHAIILSLASLAMMSLAIYGILSTFLDKIIFTEDCIEFVEVRRTRVVEKSMITGYRVNKYGVNIIANNEDYQISSHYSGSNDVFAWLVKNYVNPDQERFTTEEKEIMNDASFGLDKSERIQNLAAARKRAKIYNISAIIIGMAIIFYPRPYNVMLGLGIIFPLVGMLFVATSGGLIKMDETAGKAYPSILSGLYISFAAVFLRGFLDFDILDYTKTIVLLLACTIFFGGILIALAIKNEISGDSLIGKLGYMFFALMYSYGLVVHLNCYYDDSIPSVTITDVLGKRATNGSNAEYYLIIDASAEGYEFDEYKVGRSKYQRIEVGDNVMINVYPGRLGILWVELD